MQAQLVELQAKMKQSVLYLFEVLQFLSLLQ